MCNRVKKNVVIDELYICTCDQLAPGVGPWQTRGKMKGSVEDGLDCLPYVLVLSFKTSKLNQTVFNQRKLKSTYKNVPETFFVSMRYYVSGIDYYFIISHLPSHEKKTYLQ